MLYEQMKGDYQGLHFFQIVQRRKKLKEKGLDSR